VVRRDRQRTMAGWMVSARRGPVGARLPIAYPGWPAGLDRLQQDDVVDGEYVKGTRP